MVYTAERISFNGYSNLCFVYGLASVAVVAVCTSSITWMVLHLAGVAASNTSTQQLVIIDTDPGVDDVMAIFATLGDPSYKLLAVTCVRGNTGVPNVIVNALKVLTVAQRLDVPVYTGHNHGLVDTVTGDTWFGKDGLGDIPFQNPPSPSSAQKEHAASFLARIVQEYPDEITIFTLGPLTNIALALHLNPNFLRQARRVVILGGSIRGQGNSGPGVEFNMYMDPAAASLVLEMASLSNSTVTLMPMDTCNDNPLTLDWRWSSLAKINNSAVTFLNKLDANIEEIHPQTAYYPYDSYAAAVSLSPDFVTYSQEYYGFVENEGRKLRGALAIDYTNATLNSANLQVVLEVNTTVIMEKLIENLSALP